MKSFLSFSFLKTECLEKKANIIQYTLISLLRARINLPFFLRVVFPLFIAVLLRKSQYEILQISRQLQAVKE